MSGTIDAVITDSIEHGDLDRAIKACNILLWKKSSGGSVSALGGNTTTTTSSPSSASPQLCRLIKIANITRELRLGFALQDWSAIRKATEDFNALRDTHMLDAAEIHRRKNTAKGTVDSKGSKLGAAVTAASLHRKSTFGNFTTTVFAPAQGRDSASSNAEQVDDHLLLFPRRWLEHSVGECAREFEFATLASHHHEIMHKLTKSLKEGRARGTVGSIDTSTVRTRSLESAILSVVDLGGGSAVGRSACSSSVGKDCAGTEACHCGSELGPPSRSSGEQRRKQCHP